MMTDEEFEASISLGYELTGVEFKGPGLASDRYFFAKVTEAILGMANRRDGGRVVIGVECNTARFNPTGLSTGQLITWNYDDITSKLAEYSDPSVNFEFAVKTYEGKNFVVLDVQEFDKIPILCKKDYPGVLRKGACYVRSRRKPETTEIPTQEDMRDLLDLAIEKGLRKYVETAYRAGIGLARNGLTQLPTTPADEDLYDQQLGDLK